MLRDCAHGRLPLIADAKLTVTRAGIVRHMIERAHVERLRSTPAPSDDDDRDSQVGMARAHNAAADEAGEADEVKKWSAAC